MATITSPRLASQSPSIAAGTPTSSTRGSVELSRTNAQNAGAAQPPRRNRAALRDYYNLKNKSASPAGGLSRTASITSVVSDSSTAASITTLTEGDGTTSVLTAPLDSADFDAEAFIQKLLAASDLRDVLKVEATLVSEIRNLDGDRKALVYDNYSKLIKAVGTIGEMQRGMNDDEKGGLREVGALETKLAALRSSVEGIVQANTQSSDRDNTQKEQRISTKKRTGQQALVRRVLAAPEKIRSLVENDDREAAEEEWRIVRDCLEKWGGVQGVDEVREQCEEIMAAQSPELDGS